jgi:hypothetical protein
LGRPHPGELKFASQCHAYVDFGRFAACAQDERSPWKQRIVKRRRRIPPDPHNVAETGASCASSLDPAHPERSANGAKSKDASCIRRPDAQRGHAMPAGPDR